MEEYQNENYENIFNTNSVISDTNMVKKSLDSKSSGVRFSEPLAEYRIISDSSFSSDISENENNSDAISLPSKNKRKFLSKVLICLCIFVFIVILLLCGFFPNHPYVSNYIIPIFGFILFCYLFCTIIHRKPASSSETNE